MENEVNVHVTWILTWIATLSYQDDVEKPFRLKQVVEVIRRINAKDSKLNVSDNSYLPMLIAGDIRVADRCLRQVWKPEDGPRNL